MALRFVESGGNYHASNTNGPGIWASSTNNNIVSNAPAGRATTFAYSSNSQQLVTNSFGNQSGLIAGFADYIITTGAQTLIAFRLGGAAQSDLRLNASAQLIVTRNGTTIAGPSTQVIASNTWNYYELKITFATGATGTAEVKLNGVTILSVSSVQTATTTAAADQVAYFPGAGTGFATDFYCLDTTTGTSTTYLGDVSVAEIFMNGAGVNAQWAVQQGSFSLTAAGNNAGGVTIYTGTITNGSTPANAWQGMYFSVTGFSNSNNNGGPWLCTASNTTAITLQNPNGVAQSNSATCSFQNPVQAGIHGGIVDLGVTLLGTRPPNDTTGPLQYIKDSTPNDISDFAHQALPLTGSISLIVHVTLARKDDAGTRTIQQFVNSSGTVHTSATIGLNSSDQYYQDFLDVDPATNASWTISNFNAATFGVKEIS